MVSDQGPPVSSLPPAQTSKTYAREVCDLLRGEFWVLELDLVILTSSRVTATINCLGFFESVPEPISGRTVSKDTAR
jgi:hypothetical protein